MADIKETLTLLRTALTEDNLTRAAIKTEGFEIELERTPAAVIQADGTNKGGYSVAVTDVKAEEAAPAGDIVKAPIIGVFYESSAPGKPPFVKQGDRVKKGDVLFIIESMKVMNEVNSEFDGTVEEIMVTNGAAVEYDQPVMRIV
jgi:acetyl-CoA carboxylase biotin carboxyl carrier protein